MRAWSLGSLGGAALGMAFGIRFCAVLGAITTWGTSGRACCWLVTTNGGFLGSLSTRLHASNFFGVDGVANKVFDALDLMTLTVLGERDRIAIAPGTTGTSNSVNVVFSLHGQVKVDGVADGLHINSARSHISGN
jgi:hypothetical protein